jgi:hypothetical protein
VTCSLKRLDNDNALLEFSERSAARAVLAKLRQLAPRGFLAGLQWRQLQWWPLSDHWAAYQLYLFDKAERLTKEEEHRAELLRRQQAHAAERQQQLRVVPPHAARSGVGRRDAWDDGFPTQQEQSSTKTSSRRSGAPKGGRDNVYGGLVDSDDD